MTTDANRVRAELQLRRKRWQQGREVEEERCAEQERRGDVSTSHREPAGSSGAWDSDLVHSVTGRMLGALRGVRDAPWRVLSGHARVHAASPRSAP